LSPSRQRVSRWSHASALRKSTRSSFSSQCSHIHEGSVAFSGEGPGTRHEDHGELHRNSSFLPGALVSNHTIRPSSVNARPSKFQTIKASIFANTYSYMFNMASNTCLRPPLVAERRCERNAIETCPSVESVKTFSRAALRCTQSSKSPRLLAHDHPFAPMFNTKGNRCRSRVLVLQYSHWKSSYLCIPSLSCLIRGFGTRDGITDSCNGHCKILIAYV